MKHAVFYNKIYYFRCNVGYASTCNTVGQTAGFFLGYVLFLAVESADFSNKYLRSEHSEHGMVTLPGITFSIIFETKMKV